MSTTGPDLGKATHPAVCFLGDDFTGSTDALGQYWRFGLRSYLFFRVPTESAMPAAAAYEVVGVASCTRSLTQAPLEREVLSAFRWFESLAPKIVQYKICSTVDSSPNIGNIGRVVEIGRRVFGRRPVLVAPAQPEFGRFTLFANQYARDGSRIYRLDRHPTMSQHPATPMDEADVRLLLEHQARLRVASIDILQLRRHRSESLKALRGLLQDGPAAVVADALEDRDLSRAVQLWWPDDGVFFAEGSGGLSRAIASEMTGVALPQRTGRLSATTHPLLVLSGSQAPQTRRQIAHVLAQPEWTAFRLGRDNLHNLRSGHVADDIERGVLESLGAGRNTVVYSDSTSGQPETARPSTHLDVEFAAKLGTALGRLLQSAVATGVARRVVICGGDTAGYAMRAVRADGMEILSAIGPATFVGLVSTTSPPRDGIELVLKGGQAGADDFFSLVQKGTPAPLKT